MAMRGVGGSCLSCRTRKVRCDRYFPQCSQCKQRSLECIVPEAPPRLLWLPTKTFGDTNLENEDTEAEMHVRRQPLFARERQAQHAADLLASTSNSSLGTILEQLDLHGNELQEGTSASHGPFHVFCTEEATVPSTLPTDVLGLELWRFLSDCNAGTLDEEELITIPWPTNTCIADDDIALPEEVEGQTSSPSPQNQQAPSEPPVYEPQLSFGPSMSPPSDLQDFSMPTAKLLLDHYQTISITLYTPAPVESKTPWEILYVPNLLSTLGEIALIGNSSDARLSLLFAVLAISAFRLDIIQPHTNELATPDWHSLGELYRERATRRLQMTLRGLSGAAPKREKYKNILMPLLSMVTICAVSGEMKNAAHYLSDIEQIITRYGIPKVRKSRKVKMLHSIYLYLRILTKGAHNYDRSRASDSDNSANPGARPSSQETTWDVLLEESSHTHDTLNLNFMQNLAPVKTTFEQTIYHLLEYDKHKELRKDRSSDICWPAFIAGCEAISLQFRQQISDWLRKSTNSSGMLMFRVAIEALERVWAARSLPGNQDRSWSSILSESTDMRVLVLS